MDSIMTQNELLPLLTKEYQFARNIWKESKYHELSTFISFYPIFKQAVQDARKEGIKIISNARGYKITDDLDEWNHFLIQEEKYVLAKLSRMAKIRNEKIGFLVKDILSRHILDEKQLPLYNEPTLYIIGLHNRHKFEFRKFHLATKENDKFKLLCGQTTEDRFVHIFQTTTKSEIIKKGLEQSFINCKHCKIAFKEL